MFRLLIRVPGVSFGDCKISSHHQSMILLSYGQSTTEKNSENLMNALISSNLKELMPVQETKKN